MSGFRRQEGGLIDRASPLSFSFDGRAYTGFEGDTLASALLANGVVLMGRSFKYHRPRGLLSAGVEEPNALISVGAGGRFEPNTRATQTRLYQGLMAVSQNRWPSLRFDLGALNGLIGRFIPAGFYYKTFFGGPRLWRIYEHFIRRAAGLGKAPQTSDPDRFEHRAAFCELLVVGAGPAGLAAAMAAASCGRRVILVEQDSLLGGSLLCDAALIEGGAWQDWAERVRAMIRAAGGRVLTRTVALGYWDHNLVTLAERRCEPGQTPPGDVPVQRLWRVRAERVALATGTLERPLLFGGNDLPGVMLSSAVRTYVQRFAVAPGRRAVIAACNDDAYLTALALLDAGVVVEAVLDSRDSADSEVVRQVRRSIPVHFGAHPVQAVGGVGGVKRLKAQTPAGSRWFGCDLVAVSGGFTPAAHLHRQAGGGLDWDPASAAFIPGDPLQGQVSIGAAAGSDSLANAIADGWRAGQGSSDLPPPSVSSPSPEANSDGSAYDPAAAVDLKSAFVDYQNDVTVADIDLAWREGYRSVEHLKRYTTLGMATDQGKTSNLIGLARLAKAEGRAMSEVGVTTFRPPYVPVTLGLLAGETTGTHLAPQRRLPLYHLHLDSQPLWQPSGYWSRPRAFPRHGEGLAGAALREAQTVRTTAGLTDVSTLAKFEVAGPDAAALLEIVCATSVAKLVVGRGRYTFMLREDGMVMDDGTVWRVGEQRYLLTSSTGGADRMVGHLSYARQILAPALKVAVANVQEHWAAAALAGPAARAVLETLLENEPPRHMSTAMGQIAGVPVRVLAASYSGERAFEIYVAAFQAAPVWRALLSATQTAGGGPYGLEALELLRIEKGHVEVGAEIDGRRTPADLGLNKMLNPRAGYIGAPCLARPSLQSHERQTLVGLEAEGPIPEGAMLVPEKGGPPEGHVTSAGLRLTRSGAVALGLLRNGAARLGETLLASSPTRNRTVSVRIAPPHFHDPLGERYRD